MPATSIYTLLRNCAVRIELDQRPLGTGFFVAPGLVLTCAHVVSNLSDPSLLTLTWQASRFPVRIQTITNVDYPDLALLEVDFIDHPCAVFQSSDTQPFDRLYTFGYSDQYPMGDPATPECEGATGGPQPLLRLKNAQIRPGMSGSPILNQRTERICALMQLTRNRETDLGGRALPTSIITQHFPELVSLQAAYEKQQQTWSTSTKAVSLYYVYDGDDRKLQQELSKHLRLLRYQNFIADWDLGEIDAGDLMTDTVNEYLNTSEIILLLISTSFIVSPFCYGKAMKRALERRDEGNATVIPVLLRSCDWEIAPFKNLQPLPRNRKAVDLAPNRDLIFTEITKEIRGLIEKRVSPTAARP